jgi:hypothetical protein
MPAQQERQTRVQRDDDPVDSEEAFHVG